jgi:hypothetical protein
VEFAVNPPSDDRGNDQPAHDDVSRVKPITVQLSLSGQAPLLRSHARQSLEFTGNPPSDDRGNDQPAHDDVSNQTWRSPARTEREVTVGNPK